MTYIRHRISMLMQEGYQEPRTESEACHMGSEYTYSVQCGNCPQYGDYLLLGFIVKSLALCSRPSASRAGGEGSQD